MKEPFGVNYLVLSYVTFQLISHQNHLSKDRAIDNLKKNTFLDFAISYRVYCIQRFL